MITNQQKATLTDSWGGLRKGTPLAKVIDSISLWAKDKSTSGLVNYETCELPELYKISNSHLLVSLLIDQECRSGKRYEWTKMPSGFSTYTTALRPSAKKSFPQYANQLSSHTTPLLLSAGVDAKKKLKIGVWRYTGYTGCQMVNHLDDGHLPIDAGKCYTPKDKKKFQEIYYDYALEWIGHTPDPSSWGFCQLNLYEEPDCEGHIMLEHKQANQLSNMQKCLQINNSTGHTHAGSLQIRCDKNGALDKAPGTTNYGDYGES